jgi:hypothetical protein
MFLVALCWSIGNSVLKVGDKVISVLASILYYLFMAFCCLSVTFLFIVYIIGMALMIIWIIKE